MTCLKRKKQKRERKKKEKGKKKGKKREKAKGTGKNKGKQGGGLIQMVLVRPTFRQGGWVEMGWCVLFLR